MKNWKVVAPGLRSRHDLQRTGTQGWLRAQEEVAGPKLGFKVSLAERWETKVWSRVALFPQRGTSRHRVAQLLSETMLCLLRLPG